MILLESELGKLGFNIIFTMLMAYMFKLLWSSAKNSLQRTGGKWTSIVNEVLLALVGFVVLVMVWNMDSIRTLEMIISWVHRLWKLLTPILRNLEFRHKKRCVMIARNSTIADKFKHKIYIRIIRVKIHGRLTLLLILLVNVVFVTVFGFLLSFLLSS